MKHSRFHPRGIFRCFGFQEANVRGSLRVLFEDSELSNEKFKWLTKSYTISI